MACICVFVNLCSCQCIIPFALGEKMSKSQKTDHETKECQARDQLFSQTTSGPVQLIWSFVAPVKCFAICCVSHNFLATFKALPRSHWIPELTECLKEAYIMRREERSIDLSRVLECCRRGGGGCDWNEPHNCQQCKLTCGYTGTWLGISLSINLGEIAEPGERFVIRKCQICKDEEDEIEQIKEMTAGDIRHYLADLI